MQPETFTRAEATLISSLSGAPLLTGSRWGVLSKVERAEPSGPSVRQTAKQSIDPLILIAADHRLARVSEVFCCGFLHLLNLKGIIFYSSLGKQEEKRRWLVTVFTAGSTQIKFR